MPTKLEEDAKLKTRTILLSGMCGLSYLQRLQRIGMKTLELRRLKIYLIMMFTILINLVEIGFSDFFSFIKVTIEVTVSN